MASSNAACRARRLERRLARRLSLHRPLARWGFTTCAVFALLNNLTWPALISGVIAAIAWRNR